MSARAALAARPPMTALCLAVAALAAAAWAQSVVRPLGWVSAGVFAVAALLFAIASRLQPAAPEAPLPPPPARPRASMRLFALGVVVAMGCGVAVYLGAPRLPTHIAWGVALLILAASALSARVAEGGGSAPARAAWEVDRAASLRGWRPVIPGLLLVLCALIFFWELTAIPAEVHGDDAEVGLDALRLLRNFDLFSAGWFELPTFHALPTAIGLKLFGANLLGLRATSALFGTGTVLLTFAVGRRLWNDEVGLLAALVLVLQRFFIHLSRAGYHYVDTPFLSVLVVWLFLRLWQDRRFGAAIWCGIALGLGFQTYYASRLVPGLLTLTWLAWLFAAPASERRLRFELLCIVALVALAVAAPMFGYFAHDWSAFWERTRDTSMFGAGGRAHLAWGYRTDSLLAILLIQLRESLSLFNRTADTSVQYGLEGALLDPAGAVLFILGIGALLAWPRERRRQLLALWMVPPLIIGATFTIDTPFYPRISGIIPFVALLIALALHTFLHIVRTTIGGRSGARLAGGFAIATMALIAAVNLRTYFVDYAPRYRHSPSVEIAGFVRRHGAGKTVYMIGGAPGFYIRHGTIKFLTHDRSTADIEDAERFFRGHLPPPAQSAFVIMPQGDHLIPRLEQVFGPLDLQTHRNWRGDISFLTAIPKAAEDAPDPVELLQQAHEPGRGALAMDAVLAVGQAAAPWLIAALALAALTIGGWQRWRQPRLPGAAALRVPWRERTDAWRVALFGPDERDHALMPPRWLVVVALLLVVAVAVGLRVYRLAELPAGFFCDEAGNGYNAFSLWLAGKDETGARWPLYVWSFGVSYKNPIFVYSAIVPMALLGPTELAVRLTAALWGSATVLAMFFLGRALMGPLVGLAGALLLALLPWHLHFSRIGFELITLPFFFVLAFTDLVRWTQGRRTLARAMVLFGLCLYTYVPAKLIVPLFLAGFAALYWRDLRARWRETLIAGGLLVVTALPVVIFDLAHREQSGSYFRNTTLLARDEPPLELARTFAENYTAFFSPEFLFEASNDRIIRHSVSEHGQLYPFMLPLLVIGALAALLHRDRALRLPLLWVALYPAAAALMNEIPSASRGFIGAPAFALLAAVGAGAVLRLPTRLRRRPAVVWALQGLLIVVGLAFIVPAARAYWVLYRDEYPLYSAKYYTGFQYGHRQVLDYFRRHYDKYDQLLLTTRKSNQPETFLRFYDGLHQPERPDIAPPFEHREKMLTGTAEAREHYAVPGRRMLFAVLPEEVPLFADGMIVGRVVAPDGSEAFVLVEASRLRDFISTWMIGGPLPEDDKSPPPTWTPDAPAADGIEWRRIDPPLVGVGLNDFLSPNADNVCAWAVNFVTSDRERDVRIYAGFDDTGEVWINGARVTLQPTSDLDTALVDAFEGLARLQPGRNRVAVRTCETVGDWRFYFRVEEPNGGPAEGLTWEYTPEP